MLCRCVYERAACSAQEKELLLPMLEALLTLAHKCRTRGLAACEGDEALQRYPGLAFGMELVADGVEPELIREAMETRLCLSVLEGSPLLSEIMIARAVLLIQRGVNPELMRRLLSVFVA